MPDREFKIKIISTNDPSGTQQAAQGLQDISKAAGKVAEATGEVGKEAEKTEISHRALHQILHLIGHESGPAAGAAFSGIAAAATGGMMVAIMAVRELFEWIHQAAAEAKHFKEAMEAQIDISGLVKGVTGVKDAVDKTGKSIDDFFKNLARKADGHEFKKIADEQIAHLKRVEDAEKQIAAAEAEREKARLEFLKSTHQISEGDYKAGVAAADALKSKKDSAAASQYEAQSNVVLQQALTNILAQEKGASGSLNEEKGKADPKTRLDTLAGLLVATQKKLADLEKLQQETPSYGAAFLNSFQHPTESVADFRARISDEIGAKMNELRAAAASLEAQMGDLKKNAPDSAKIKELEDKLTSLQADQQAIQQELANRNDQGTVDSDKDSAELVQKFLEAQRRLSQHHGESGDTQTVSQLNQVLQYTKQADQRAFLLLQDLIKHKGNLDAAYAELANQRAHDPTWRGSSTGQ